MNAAGEILGHDAIVHGVNANLFQGLAELDQVRVAVEVAAMFEASGPREYAGNWVGTSRVSLKQNTCWLLCGKSWTNTKVFS